MTQPQRSRAPERKVGIDRVHQPFDAQVAARLYGAASVNFSVLSEGPASEHEATAHEFDLAEKPSVQCRRADFRSECGPQLAGSPDPQLAIDHQITDRVEQAPVADRYGIS